MNKMPVIPLVAMRLLSGLALAVFGFTNLHAQDNDVVRISTNLIQLDVSVVSRDGKVVSDLKKEDFALLENGKLREISNFAFVSKAAITTVPGSAREIPARSTPLSLTSTRRVFALVIDDLTLSFESTKVVRRALSKFVDEQMTDGDLVAVIKTGGNTGVLEQLTSDKRILRAAVEKVQWKGGRAPASPLSGGEQDSEVDASLERDELLATASLSSLNHIVKRLDGLPGRKSIIFFSDGFSLLKRNESGFVDTTRVLESIRKIADSSQRAGAVVYTVDARGLQPASLTAADPMKGLRHTNAITSARRQVLAENQDGLRVLAKETGGFAIYNSNDIVGGVGRIVENRGYYLIGYQPDEDTFDPETSKFNKIEINLKRPGLTAQHLSGFFNRVGDPRSLVAQSAKGSTLANALLSPFSQNAVSLSLQTIYAKDDQEKPLVKSFLHIKGSDLNFVEKLETQKFVLDFEILAMTFADDGSPGDRLTRSYTIEMSASGKEKLVREGIVYYFAFPIAAIGAQQYRVAVRDKSTGKIGTANQFINVPNDKGNDLVLSGIGLENLSKLDWSNTAGKAEKDATSTALRDTALRQFKSGTVLTYAMEVYGQPLTKNVGAKITAQVRLFKDGSVVFTGAESPTTGGQARRTAAGALSLDLLPGEYLLQILVTNTGRGNVTASQSVSFEIIE